MPKGTQIIWKSIVLLLLWLFVLCYNVGYNIVIIVIIIIIIIIIYRQKALVYNSL